MLQDTKCVDCKFYNEQERTCSNEELYKFITISGGYGGIDSIKPDFGCVLFEKKGSTEKDERFNKPDDEVYPLRFRVY